MARKFAGSSDIYVDEFDYSGVINACTIDIDNSVADVTAFSDTDLTYVEGEPSFSITLNGLYSTATPDYDGEMFADLTSADRLITVSPAIAAATGGVAYFGQGDITSMPITSNIGSAILLNVTWNGNKPLTRGKFAYVNTAMDENDANGTGYQLGALSATQQLIAFQHVLSWTGTGTLTTTIVSDDNAGFTSATTRATFTAASAATSEREVVTGAVTDDYWRANFAWTGSGLAVSIVIAFGRAPYSA